MRNLEYLTQEDLPYFRKQAEKGEVIIIELDPVILMDIDITAMFAEIEENNSLTEEDIQNWIAAHPVLLKRQQKQMEEELRIQGEPNSDMDAPFSSQEEIYGEGKHSIEAILMNGVLNDEQIEILSAAVGEGFTDEELYLLLDTAHNTEDMKTVFQELLGDHALKGIMNARRE